MTADQPTSWLLALMPALGLIGFVGVWVGITFLLSRIGGWNVLAGRYLAQHPFSGQVHSWCSGRLGFVNYNNCLSLGANEQGLYLSVPRIFAFAHPPLFIPWSDIRAQRDKILWAQIVRFELGTAPATKLQVPRRFADKLESAARGHLLIAPKAS
jgi:hypothetical protein